MRFRRNQNVRIPCAIEPGPLDECVVTVDTDDGPISGFVKTAFVTKTSEGSGYIVGQVVDPSDSTVKVRLPGSFFTTAGLASLAASKLEMVLR